MEQLLQMKDQSAIQQWLVNWIAKESNVGKDNISIEEPFVNFGLGSRQAVILSADLEDWLNRKVEVSVAWEYPTIKDLSHHLADHAAE